MTQINMACSQLLLLHHFPAETSLISSPDTADQPLINPNWLTHPTDQQVAVAAYKRTREVFSTPVMHQIIVGPEIYPGTQVQTDEEILNTIRLSFDTVYHAAAPSKVGEKRDAMAVVDSKCRIYRLERLRVLDASSFPFLPPGHPMSTGCKYLWLLSSFHSQVIVHKKPIFTDMETQMH